MLSKYLEKEDENENKKSEHLNSNDFLVNKSYGSNLQQLSDPKLFPHSFNIKNAEEENELEMHRHEIQCELNSQGASDLVVDIFMSDTTNKVFKENVLLAIALLEGGNTLVQVINYLLKDSKLNDLK